MYKILVTLLLGLASIQPSQTASAANHVGVDQNGHHDWCYQSYPANGWCFQAYWNETVRSSTDYLAPNYHVCRDRRWHGKSRDDAGQAAWWVPNGAPPTWLGYAYYC